MRVHCAGCNESHVGRGVIGGEPVIRCQLAPSGITTRVQTTLLKSADFNARTMKRVFTGYDGPLWVSGPPLTKEPA